jgi:hypothetical protein
MSDDASLRLQKIREQNKARAKRYYEAHKATIAERRKVSRTKSNALPAHEPITFEKAVQMIQEKIESKNSQKVYISTLRIFMDIMKCTELYSCLANAQHVIDTIEQAKPRNSDGPYSINSRKTMYQMILKLITTFELPISDSIKNQYKEKFEELKLESIDETKEKTVSADKKVMRFESYLSQVKEKFGEDSKEFIIASLYNLYGFRDDLQLKISTKKPTDTEENYIVIPRMNISPHYIILNQYKTSKKNGSQMIPIPAELAKLIRKYARDNSLTADSYLFGNKSLSIFIKKFNEKLGLPITINTYRQMRISSALSSDVKPSAKHRIKIAKEMNHSAMASEKYIRMMA